MKSCDFSDKFVTG